jgi:hypothetical protein
MKQEHDHGRRRVCGDVLLRCEIPTMPAMAPRFDDPTQSMGNESDWGNEEGAHDEVVPSDSPTLSYDCAQLAVHQSREGKRRVRCKVYSPAGQIHPTVVTEPPPWTRTMWEEDSADGLGMVPPSTRSVGDG